LHTFSYPSLAHCCWLNSTLPRPTPARRIHHESQPPPRPTFVSGKPVAAVPVSPCCTPSASAENVRSQTRTRHRENRDPVRICRSSVLNNRGRRSPRLHPPTRCGGRSSNRDGRPAKLPRKGQPRMVTKRIPVLGRKRNEDTAKTLERPISIANSWWGRAQTNWHAPAHGIMGCARRAKTRLRLKNRAAIPPRKVWAIPSGFAKHDRIVMMGIATTLSWPRHRTRSN